MHPQTNYQKCLGRSIPEVKVIQTCKPIWGGDLKYHREWSGGWNNISERKEDFEILSDNAQLQFQHIQLIIGNDSKWQIISIAFAKLLESYFKYYRKGRISFNVLFRQLKYYRKAPNSISSVWKINYRTSCEIILEILD